MLSRVAAVTLASLITACGANGDNLLTVRDSLAQEFSAPDVGIMSGGQLTVVFQNSKLSDLEPSAREAAARRVAEYVRDHYSGYARLPGVGVAFVTSQRAGPGYLSTTPSRYYFEREALGPAKQVALDSALSRPPD